MSIPTKLLLNVVAVVTVVVVVAVAVAVAAVVVAAADIPTDWLQKLATVEFNSPLMMFINGQL